MPDIKEALFPVKEQPVFLHLEKTKDASLFDDELSGGRFDKIQKYKAIVDTDNDYAKGQYLKHVIDWSLTEETPGRLHFEFSINADALAAAKQQLGYRIVMTNRHEWSTAEIIQAYLGQSHIEAAFKNLKNPYHLALKPQFHWTDQKIRVHNFMCVLGYLLAALVWKQARQNANFNGSLDTLLDTLNTIRLATLIEQSSKPGRPKVSFQLEDLSKQENALLETLGIQSTHLNRPQFQGLSVYTSNTS